MKRSTTIVPVASGDLDELIATGASTIGGTDIGWGGALPVEAATWTTVHLGRHPGESVLPWWALRTWDDHAMDGIVWVDPFLPVFAGHFPGNPILPGVSQIDWLLDAAEHSFPETAAASFTGLANLKFRSRITPGSWLRIHLDEHDGTIDFVVREAARICTRGRLLFGRADAA